MFTCEFIVRAVDRFISHISRTSSTTNKNLPALEKLLRGSEISKVAQNYVAFAEQIRELNVKKFEYLWKGRNESDNSSERSQPNSLARLAQEQDLLRSPWENVDHESTAYYWEAPIR